MSALLFVTYPAAEGARFDRDYYTATHLPLVEEKWGAYGLISARAFFPAGKADPVAVAILAFDDAQAIDTALQSEETAAVLGDLPNFTDIRPTLMRGQPL